MEKTGASGGEWGQDGGGDTSNTGDGGDAGARSLPLVSQSQVL